MTSDPTYPEFKDEAIRWLLVTGRLRHELVMRMLDTHRGTAEYERIMGGLEALKILGERMHPAEDGEEVVDQ